MHSCKIMNFCFVVQLANGYPLPALKNMNLVNTQLQILKVQHHFTFSLNCRMFEQVASVTWPGFITRVKHLQKSRWKTNCCCPVFLLQDYMLIGTDVQFTGWMVRLETPTIPWTHHKGRDLLEWCPLTWKIFLFASPQLFCFSLNVNPVF